MKDAIGALPCSPTTFDGLRGPFGAPLSSTDPSAIAGGRGAAGEEKLAALVRLDDAAGIPDGCEPVPESMEHLLAQDAIDGLKDALAGRFLSDDETEAHLHAENRSPP